MVEGTVQSLSKNINFKNVLQLKLSKLNWKIIYLNKLCIL